MVKGRKITRNLKKIRFKQKNYKIIIRNYIKRPKEANNTKWKMCCLLVAILIIVSVLMVPVNFQETYEATESYTEKEPYTAIEIDYVKEPYTVDVPLNYMVLYHRYYDLIHRDYYTRENFPNYYWTSACDVSVIVKNTDDVGGNFWVTLYVTTSTGFDEYTTDSVFLKSGDSHKFIHTFQGDYNSSTYDVHTEKKEVIEYRDVPKEITVTKYRDVIKERAVLKTRTVQKPIYEIIYSLSY
ncbi:hypothetical protein ACFLY8_05690 [Halobacteriota archaeon]